MKRMRIVTAVAVLVGLAGQGAIGAALPADEARQILQAAGVTGGLVVHLGCGDGRLTAALRASEAYTVHGLARDAATVAKARATVRQKGLYGPVSVDRLAGSCLPYVDNLVTLLVADDLAGVPVAEVMRVLSPSGVAVVGGKKTVKPRPEAIDDWTHYLHDASNNAVARDTVVGPPRRLQWQSGPKWTRHHDHMSSLSAMVSDGRRLFYILDEGSPASLYLPSHWALIARDAFNGKRLWSRPLGTWYTRFKGLKDGPADAPRRLVVAGGRVYVTLDLHGPVVALDAVTGRTVREYAATEGAEEILLSGDTLFALVGPGSIGTGARLTRPAEKRTIMALDVGSGAKRWQASDVVGALTMAVDGAGVYYFNFASGQVVGLDRRSGRRRWASATLPAPEKQMSFFASKLVVYDGVVLLASGELSGMTKSGGGERRDDTLTALAADTGKTLWTGKHPPSGYSSPENLFVIDGLVWCDASSSGGLKGRAVAYDLKTGRVQRDFTEDETSYWFHHRCYPGRATSNYIITSRTGAEFIDLSRKHWDLNHWTRGACLYGLMPCNGLLYTPPAPCICYAETMLHHFNALAPAGGSAPATDGGGPRLVKGPAYGSGISQPTSRISPPRSPMSAAGWPTYRGNNARTGATATRVPARLRSAWTATVGGRLSSVTVAAGKVFVADVDRHTVHALDAGTGKDAWSYTVGGRVDSPPTVHEGLVLFGSADGHVTCLRATDGALVWRFRAAVADRRILALERVESLWPVHGSILVQGGMAHFVAGRSVFVDGGMRLVRLDARTGRLISETVLDDRDPKTGENLHGLVKWLNMPVGRPDVLSSDGKYLYMRSQAFDLEGRRLAMGPRVKGPDEGKQQGGETTHLFCPTGFLDDTWFHRTYWLYAETWSSGWNGYFVAGKYAPAGRIMSVGTDHVYVFGRQPKYYRWTTPLEYRLFAARKQWRAAPKAKGVTVFKAAPKPAAKKGAKGKKKAEPPGPVQNPQNYAWSTSVPILVRAMTLTDRTLFIAGPKDVLDESQLRKADPGPAPSLVQQEAALRGDAGALLWVVSADDGTRLAEYPLASPPVMDGMVAAGGRLYVSLVNGTVVCLGAQ